MALTPVLACRVCQTTDNLELIFTKENAEILSMLNSFLSTVITYNEALPLCVCIQCIFTLEENYEFKSLYQKTYNKFKNKNLRNEPWQDPQVKLEKSGGSRVFLADGTISDKSEIIEDSNKSKELDENEKEKSIDDNGDNSQEENSIDEIPVSNEPETSHAYMLATDGSSLKLHKCDKCEKSFEKRENLLRHVKLHSTLKLYKCEDCGKSFSTNNYLQIHKKSHNKIHKCDECGKCYTNASVLKNHKVMHLGLKYECDKCGDSFTRPDYLKQHQAQRCKRMKSGLRTCEHCGKSFTKLHTYQRHQEFHKNLDLYKCEDCGQVCTTSFNLALHKKSKWHQKESIMCENSESPFSRTDSLEKPEVLHTNVQKASGSKQKHKCDECDKSFLTYYRYRAHKALHANPDLYKCDGCGTQVQDPISLRVHQRRFCRAKGPFKCRHCERLCVTLDALERHQVLHLKPDLYKCHECNRFFDSLRYLIKHKSAVHSNVSDYKLEVSQQTE